MFFRQAVPRARAILRDRTFRLRAIAQDAKMARPNKLIELAEEWPSPVEGVPFEISSGP